MAKDQTRRLRREILVEDEEILIALKNLPNYNPSNPAYSVANLSALQAHMHAQRETEIVRENALKASRDDATAAEWAYHNAILGGKAQVVAQYGDDSNEVQSIGLKKKSERRRGGSHKAASTEPPTP